VYGEPLELQDFMHILAGDTATLSDCCYLQLIHSSSSLIQGGSHQSETLT